MDLKEFSKSNYMDYLSKYEKDYLVKYGRFHNVDTVKNQLSKQFKNVSIRGRGKSARVYIGKSRFTNKAKTLQETLITSIVYRLDEHSHSLSQWGRMIGIDTTFPTKDYMDGLNDDDRKIINWLATFVSTKRRNYFEKAYRKAIKAVGGTWSIVDMAETKAGKVVRVPVHLSKELAELRKKLHGQGIFPTQIRKSKAYKRVLSAYGYKYDWYAYLATFDQNNQNKIREQGNPVTWQQVNDLFKAELMKDLKGEMDKQETSAEVTELLDMGIVTKEQVEKDLGIVAKVLDNGAIIDKWEEFRPKLIVDEPRATVENSKVIDMD